MSRPTAPSRISFTVCQKPLESLLQELEDKRIEIPLHQREYCWKEKRQQRFIETLIEGTPCPNIVLREHARDTKSGKTTLEDGQQRLTTARRFMDDSFVNKDGRKFSELSLLEQIQFKTYPMPVLTYNYKATDAQAVDIFDNFQNGVPLTVGERYYSLKELSPIVRLTEEMLMKSGEGYHDRLIPIWGARSGKDHRRTALTNAVALVAGLCFGSEYISKKWDDMSAIVKSEISLAQKRKVYSYMEMIIRIYEDVQKEQPISTKSDINYQWDLGHITGYMAYSFIKKPEMAEHLMAGWTAYLIDVRKNKAVYDGKISKALEAKLHMDIDGARSWKDRRWELGYLRVFDPEAAKRVAAGIVADNSSTADSDDE
jgi:hypothetical protein